MKKPQLPTTLVGMKINEIWIMQRFLCPHLLTSAHFYSLRSLLFTSKWTKVSAKWADGKMLTWNWGQKTSWRAFQTRLTLNNESVCRCLDVASSLIDEIFISAVQKTMNYVFLPEFRIFQRCWIDQNVFPRASMQPSIVLHVARAMFSQWLYSLESWGSLDGEFMDLKIPISKWTKVSANFPGIHLHTKSGVARAPKNAFWADVWSMLTYIFTESMLRWFHDA